MNFKNNSMSTSSFCKYQNRSRQNTEVDSSSDKDEQFFCPKTNPAKHKTQLCRTFSQLGACPYNYKCRFAHGKYQLIRPTSGNISKARKCNGFWKNGCCSYGIRCQFGHAESNWEDSAILMGLEASYCHKEPKKSKLMSLLY